MGLIPSIVVTGWGLVTPLGKDADSTWVGLLNGKSPVRNMTGEEWGPFQEPRAACVEGLEVHSEYLKRDRSLQLAHNAVREAWTRAGLSKVPAERIGATFSSSKGGVVALLRAREQWNRGVAPETDFLADFFPHSAGSFLKRTFGFCGPTLSLSSACATGLASIAEGAALLEKGLCDAVITGSAESSLHPLFYSAFQNMGLLTGHAEGSRPFDEGRDGFLLGEGAGALVLEREDTARKRGAEAVARLSGWALGSDGQGYLEVDSEGNSIVQVIHRALQKAGLEASDISYVNAHGTGTRLNDRVEGKAIHRVFGEQGPWVSSTKGATGHLLGAAGSVEAVFTVLSLLKGEVPDTRNLSRPDPECLIRHVGKGGMKLNFDHALSLSYGIGGQLGAVVFSKG